MNLSVVIITFNEEQNIGRCIHSVQAVADETLVVDSYSTDGTRRVCEELGVRFIEHRFDGHIEQKNWAITQATNDWVLSLDADEALDDTLRENILAIKASPQVDGYSMNRMTNYCGKWIKHGGWYPDVKLRLWNSTKGSWGGTNPHDRYELQAGSTTAHLKGDILHYSFTTTEQHDEQIAYFTDIAAKALHARGKKSGSLRAYFSAAHKFLKDFLFKLGFLDGSTGFTIAWKSAGASYMKYTKLAALNRRS